MIQLKNVNKTYQTKVSTFTALQDINLTVNTGEIFGVIGKSGAGKSTLIRCINLLERPTSGQVFVADQELTALNKPRLRNARHKIGMVFQQFNLLNSRTVYQNVALPLQLLGKSKQQINDTIFPLLELTGLAEKSQNYPSELSGGQKQRVAIARALTCQPEVLLCDEATSALDLHTTESILQLLKNINEKFKLTILLITHEMDVIKKISDRIALLENGKIIEQATTEDFFIAPKTETAKALVKSSLKQELPANLSIKINKQKTANTNPVVQIFFHGKAAEESLITHLVQNFGIKLNILQANIEYLKKTTLGVMVAEVIENDNFSEAIKYLETHDVQVEIIGYVRRDVMANS